MRTEDMLRGIDREVKDIVADAAEFAQNSPEPDPSEIVDRHSDRGVAASVEFEL